MAVKTKIYLDDSKVIQPISSILSLSGTTYSFGTISGNSTSILNSDSGYRINNINILNFGNNNPTSIQVGCGASAKTPDSVSVGNLAGYYSCSGSNNTFIGSYAGYAASGGSCNVAIGYYSLANNYNGYDNIAIGTLSMIGNNCGNCNIAIGYNSLLINSSGSTNTALGAFTLTSNISGCDNVAIGQQVLFNNIKGCNNLGLGNYSLIDNISGSSNIAIGQFAGYSNITGCSNIFIGTCAGYSANTSNKLYIHNGPTNQPLIHGDFSNSELKINGALFLRDVLSGSTGDYMLTWDCVTCSIKIRCQSSGGASVCGVPGNLPMFDLTGSCLVDSGINAYLVYAGL